jgi:hypothetical protein
MKIRFDKSRAVFVPYSAYEKYQTDPGICKKTKDENGLEWCDGDCEGGGECLPETWIDPDTGKKTWWCECKTKSQRKKLYEEGLIQARELLSPEDFEKYTQRMAEEFSD